VQLKQHILVFHSVIYMYMCDLFLVL
jgi:hypothetical protein